MQTFKYSLFVLIGSLALAGCNWFKPLSTNQSWECTDEAMICSDGSAVGRRGPNCEFAPCPSPSTNLDANITVSQPTANQLLTLPITVTGEARVFENVLSVALVDANGQVFSEMVTEAKSPDVGQFGPFVATFKTKPSSKTGFVKVFSHSAKDGSEINVVIIPVRFE